jgi:hypothetical protein
VSAQPELPPEIEAELRSVAADDEVDRIAAAYARIRALADAVAAASLEPSAWTQPT